MSDTTASLSRKITSAGDLQSVVRTMKALAASSIGQYEKSVSALGDYNRTVELGLGLSPSTNDTTTAIVCVDYLTAILARLTLREIPSCHRYEAGELRVITIGPTFASLVAESFDQIRTSGSGNVAILLRLLDALQTIASLTDGPGRRRVLGEHVTHLADTADRTLESPHDQARFGRRLAQVQAALAAAPSPTPEQSTKANS